ncbi:flagellar assembly peptidoglycan hydrolase FlgJ [Thalassotalea sp. M1531]|uniref:Peptidoglycan hydrolase FlgJ n=1 Tax=Thalassotalea algicola TaxID=2716224 RepID=A0A7Y0LFR0_9GAMM|nr:flagellar assembly peptidoglycan hydrolase FlgJ [Thalassotalea algicola]NMP32881.1 flagellar assembly peptidoglycan hydrolase FlgJ [Thalassotalea algicola]
MDNKLAEARNFFDLNSLNNIRQQANETDQASKKAALKEAAQQFESIFMQMLLKSMRKAEEVLESDSPFNSQSTKFYRDMHDQQLAVEMSANGSLGLAELIERQLGGGDGNFTPSSVLRTEQQAPKAFKIEQFAEKFLQGPSNNRQVNDNSVLLNSQTKESEITFKAPKDFVTALQEPAKTVQKQLGIPFEVVIAQAALETGWGQKVIKTNNGKSSNNLFNIKADRRWAGDSINKDTLEYEQGAMVKKREPFRVYDSIKDSVNDYVNFLSSGERYQEALTKPENVEHFLQGLQKAGYATDPKYAEKIMGTLKTVTNLLSN